MTLRMLPGTDVAVPVSEMNPPGPTALVYRVGTHATFLETCSRGLPLIPRPDDARSGRSVHRLARCVGASPTCSRFIKNASPTKDICRPPRAALGARTGAPDRLPAAPRRFRERAPGIHRYERFCGHDSRWNAGAKHSGTGQSRSFSKPRRLRSARRVNALAPRRDDRNHHTGDRHVARPSGLVGTGHRAATSLPDAANVI